VAEIAAKNPHNERENIPARTAPEAVKDFLFWVNVKRGMSFCMEWASPEVLFASPPQRGVLGRYVQKVGSSLHFVRTKRFWNSHRRTILFGRFIHGLVKVVEDGCHLLSLQSRVKRTNIPANCLT
jgi:hypothetical protein